MWAFLLSLSDLLYKFYITETCTVSIRFSPPGESGKILMFRYVPIEFAKEMQNCNGGSFGHFLLIKLLSTNTNLTKKTIFGIYLDEEILSTLSESSNITRHNIKKNNVFLKIGTLCKFIEFYKIYYCV